MNVGNIYWPKTLNTSGKNKDMTTVCAKSCERQNGWLLV